MNRRLFSAISLAIASLVTAPTAFAQNKMVMGVSIPAATHGWTGGVVYWANRTKAELEKQYPGSSVIVKTAGSAAEQANQVQDLQTVNKIDTLVILPFESAPLTKPVGQVKSKGVFVTVVDRGLTDPTAQNAYVAGDNPGFGKVAGEYMAKAMGGKGNVVVLRGTNDDEIEDFARLTIDRPWHIRFIELMPVGDMRELTWDHVVPTAEVLDRISELGALSDDIDGALVLHDE